VRIVDSTDLEALSRLYAGGWQASADVRATVAQILAEVRERGDEALMEYTRKFDYPAASREGVRIEIPSLDAARSALPEEVADGFALAHDRITRFHELQRPHDVEHRDGDGTLSAFLVRPLSAVGAYVPGGSARLPSSLLMTVVPAKIARVERVVVVTPPRRDGSIDPAILFAAKLCGVDELYAVGGAQAIAALAYGTETIGRVDKIVGPGNVWVTEAKRQVFGTCAIDGLAGPSEVLVLADDSADARLVAGELLAQAEHDPLARVAVASDDRTLLERVGALLEGSFATECGRSEIIENVLRDGTYLIYARDRAAMLDVVERFAPEHLSLQLRDPWSLVPHVRRAGAIFVGAETPVAAGDYLAGSNHVLPTSGSARFSSGLRTADFYRTMSIVHNSADRMRHDAPILAALAEFEGLPAHARTAALRSTE
jgi:histidinol dehydrogenase